MCSFCIWVNIYFAVIDRTDGVCPIQSVAQIIGWYCFWLCTFWDAEKQGGSRLVTWLWYCCCCCAVDLWLACAQWSCLRMHLCVSVCAHVLRTLWTMWKATNSIKKCSLDCTCHYSEDLTSLSKCLNSLLCYIESTWWFLACSCVKNQCMGACACTFLFPSLVYIWSIIALCGFRFAVFDLLRYMPEKKKKELFLMCVNALFWWYTLHVFKAKLHVKSC